MAKGPFGNPLSTGIALSGVIDMVTPVRQAQERKRKRQAEEKAAQDKRAKELGSIMGKIAIDEDKIWWRYHDDARAQYANTIDKVQQMYSAGDYAGMYKTINDFDSRMANYTQATTLKNKRREELAKGKYYMDSNLENMAESRDVDNEEYGKLLAESGYGAYGEDRMFSYMPNAEIYDIKNAWERELKGEKQLLITEGEKAITQVGKTPSGVIAQKDYNPSVITNAQQRIRSDIYRDPYRGARILEKNGYDVSSLESITDPTQRAEKTLEMFDDYIMKNRPGVDQQVLNVRAAKATKPTYGVTDDNIGDVSFSGKPSSVVSTESSTPEQIKQGRLDYVTNELQETYDVAKAKDPDDIEDAFGGEGGFANTVKGYGLDWYVPNAPGRQEVEITAKGVTHSLDPTKPDFVQKVADLIIGGGDEEEIKLIASTPETTVEEFLTPESDSFFANIAGGKKPTTDWAIPAGATVILTGDQGAVEVKLKNDMTFEKGKFQKAAKYKDKSGDTDTYYDIMFPIDQRDKESYFTNLFNDSDVLTDFKIKSPDQLPKSMYIKEDRGLFKSLLSVLQTSKNIGTMTKGSLQKAMDKFMKVSAPAKRTEIKESEIAAKAAASGHSEAEYRQLLIDNGINIIP